MKQVTGTTYTRDGKVYRVGEPRATYATGTQGPAKTTPKKKKKLPRPNVPGNQQGYGARQPAPQWGGIPPGEKPVLPGELLGPGDRGTEHIGMRNPSTPTRAPRQDGGAAQRAAQAGWVGQGRNPNSAGSLQPTSSQRFKTYYSYKKPGGQIALSRQGQQAYSQYRHGSSQPLPYQQWLSQGRPAPTGRVPVRQPKPGTDPVATAPGAPANPQSPAGPTPGSTPTLQNPNGAPLPGAPVPVAPTVPAATPPVVPQLPTGPAGNAGAPLTFEQFQQIQPYLLQGQPVPPWIMQQLGMQPAPTIPGVA